MAIFNITCPISYFQVSWLHYQTFCQLGVLTWHLLCVYNPTEKISGPSIRPSRVFVIAGESSVNLTCESQGSITNIEWTKDGKPLSFSNRFTLPWDNRTLLISPVERTDTGVYECRLSNPISAMTTNYTMTVSCEYLFKLLPR